MIRTGIADIRPLYEEDVYKKYYESVPVFRKEKANRLCQMKQKAQSIGVWILYERLRELWGIPAENVYNLSHSGDYVLCSLDDSGKSNIEIGCDMEEIKKCHEKLVNRYFLPEEQKYIMGKEAKEERLEAFYRYWVLKESFMKATRRGMGLGLNSFEIQIKNGEPCLAGKPEEIAGDYYFREYGVNIPYKICVCASECTFAEELQRIEL